MKRLHPCLVPQPSGQESGLVAFEETCRSWSSGEEDACAEGVCVAVEGEAVDADAFVFGVEVDDAVGVEELGAVYGYRGG